VVTEPLPAEAERVFDQESPPAPARRPPWVLVLAGLAGLAVGAVAVGGVWLLSGAGKVIDKRAITAPATLGEYVQIDQIDLSKDPRVDRTVDRTRRLMRENTRLLSEAHGGAGALWTSYMSRDFTTRVVVQAYRDLSEFPLFQPYEDTTYLGMAKPSQSVEQFGDVSCLVNNDPTPEGRAPAPDSVHVVRCARASDVLTVEITDVVGDFEPPEKLARFVDDVWAAVS
jgi:hypothetical protein